MSFQENRIGISTKSMKKVFPILKYLKDDDIIIDADDDILFPKDLIESRVNDFKKYGGKYQITSNPKTSIGFDGKMKIVQAMSLFQKKMLNNWQKFVTRRVLETYNDDRTYLYLVYLNGYRNIECSKWTVQELLEKYDMKLPSGMKENNVHMIGRRYDFVAEDEVKRITGKNIKNSFGYWK